MQLKIAKNNDKAKKYYQDCISWRTGFWNWGTHYRDAIPFLRVFDTTCIGESYHSWSSRRRIPRDSLEKENLATCVSRGHRFSPKRRFTGAPPEFQLVDKYLSCDDRIAHWSFVRLGYFESVPNNCLAGCGWDYWRCSMYCGNEGNHKNKSRASFYY